MNTAKDILQSYIEENIKQQQQFEDLAQSRTLHQYQNIDQQCFLNVKSDQQIGQFAHLYFTRYQQIKPFIFMKMELCFTSDGVQYIDYINMVKDCRQEVSFIGIVCKKMKNVPTVLNRGDDADMQTILGYNMDHNYINKEEDQVYLQDPTGKIMLNKKLSLYNLSSLSSGVVLGVKGQLDKNQHFIVRQVVLPGAPESKPLPEVAQDAQPKYISFLSGIQFGGQDQDFVALQALKQFLQGSIGSFVSKSIKRLVIAGNSMKQIDELDHISRASYRNKQANAMQQQYMYFHNYPSNRIYQRVSEIRKQLDGFFSIISKIVPIDLMPGQNDLSTCLPQEPFPKFLFPKTFYSQSCKQDLSSKKMVMASNPHRFIFDNVDILGTSGQNVKSFMAQSDVCSGNEIRTLKYFLDCRHISPASPQLLRAQNSVRRDKMALTPIPIPASMEDFKMNPQIDQIAPHILFSGNMKQFSFSQYEEQNIWCLCVPKFSTSKSIVMVDINKMTAKVIKICNLQ